MDEKHSPLKSENDLINEWVKHTIDGRAFHAEWKEQYKNHTPIHITNRDTVMPGSQLSWNEIGISRIDDIRERIFQCSLNMFPGYVTWIWDEGTDENIQDPNGDNWKLFMVFDVSTSTQPGVREIDIVGYWKVDN